MGAKRLLVVGASGDVGQGIIAIAAQKGWSVVATARNAARLSRAVAAHPGVVSIEGDLSTDDSARALWDAAIAPFGGIDAVAIAVNAPNHLAPAIEWTPDRMAGIFADNVLTHFIALRNFLPRLAPDGILIGIGGGTADFIIPNMVPVSMAQAALRMMYRGFAREQRDGAAIRELMIVSMVNGQSKRDRATPDWLTEMEVGQHVCAIIEDPAAFPDPVLQLKSREQIGQSALSVAP